MVSYDVIEFLAYINGELIFDQVLKYDADEIVRAVVHMIPHVMIYLLDYCPACPVYTLPDGRAGILRARDALAYLLIRERYVSTSLFVNEVDSRFLAELESLHSRPSSREIEEVAKLIEDELETRFMYDRASPEKFVVEHRGIRLPLLRSPSGLREVAPIVYLVKFKLRPGDVFIVEEPEAHLHPRAQSVITRALAALAARGIKVIVTTHSIHVIDEVNNLIRLRGLSGEVKRRRGYREWEGLSPDLVAVYSFRHNGTVERVGVGENGLSETDLDRAVIELSNVHALVEGELRKRSA